MAFCRNKSADPASLSAVNPSVTDSCYKSFDPEPQYEDIDKYDYIIKSSGEEEAYEKMKSVQLVGTHVSNGIGLGSSQEHVLATQGHVIQEDCHMTKNPSHMISDQDYTSNSLEYDYAAVH